MVITLDYFLEIDVFQHDIGSIVDAQLGPLMYLYQNVKLRKDKACNNNKQKQKLFLFFFFISNPLTPFTSTQTFVTLQNE